MSESRILTARCPGCNTAVRVKTHSLEKTVACPKCKASVTVSATSTSSPVVSAEEELPVAEYWPDAPSTGKGRMVPALGMAIAGLVVGVAISFLLREGGSSASNTVPVNPTIPLPENVTPDPIPSPPPPPVPAPVASKSVSPEKVALDKAQARVNELSKQIRDWKAANYGREAAKQKKLPLGKGSGVIVVEVPEAMQRLYDKALQELEMAKIEYQRSK